MLHKHRLFTPGPTPPFDGSQAPPHHRSGEFGALFAEVRERLKTLFGTSHEVVIFSASGTGGMEACTQSLLGAQDAALIVNTGRFGARWAELARRTPAHVFEYAPPPGEPAWPDDLEQALQENPQVSAVFVQGVDTSTGVLNPVRELAQEVRAESGALVIVDGITWLGAHAVEMDASEIDVCVGASQKALGLPPGLAFVALGPRAQARLAERASPGVYFDLGAELASQKAGRPRFTPNVELIARSADALRFVTKVGLEIFNKNAEVLASVFRCAMNEMQLTLFARAPANSVTVVNAPAGVASTAIVQAVKERFGAVIADGQDDLLGRVIRVSHLGHVDYLETLGLIGALEQVLDAQGHKFQPGAGLMAAQREWQRVVGKTGP